MDNGSVPLRAGIGLRSPHHRSLLAERPPVGWVEVHSENFYGAGGAALATLGRVREHYPVALHGVGLSLGSADGFDDTHLEHLARLAARIEPILVSEHLCWGSIGGRASNDLLPMPATREAADLLVERIDRVQSRLGRRILIENVSSYVSFAHEDWPEPVFLAEVARRAGCGILLDLNNIYVSARNHGFDAEHYLDALDGDRIGEYHLAGHHTEQLPEGELRIDTHDRAVCHEVWALYDSALARFGTRPTLIEWDAELPELEVLVDEACKADRRMTERDARAA